MILSRMSAVMADSYLTSSVLDAFINEAVQQVVSEVDLPWLQTTTPFLSVVGQTNYTLSSIATSEWYRVHSLFDSLTGTLLELRTIQEVDRLNYPVGVVNGDPFQYAIFGDQLILAPAPMDIRTFMLHWYQREPVLVGDNDQLLMPGNANWHIGVVEYATYLALRSVREDARAESAYEAYTRWLARTKDEKIRFHESIRIRVRPGNMI
ncbi:MAG: hypothetical protein ACREQ5_03735 [Candidatus Dormibacteria bacterium]